MEIVAHRAGNRADTAQAAQGHVDAIELDVHVHRGQVEVRHAKLLRPTGRLWEKWYLLPRDSTGVPIEQVLEILPPSMPLMIDLKCFTRRSSRLILHALPTETPVIASTRSWWTLQPFRSRARTRTLRSCGTRWQLWWALNISRFVPGDGVCVHEARLSPEVLARLRQRAPLLFSWGATTRHRCEELEAAGLTGVILDDFSLAPRGGADTAESGAQDL